MGASIPVESGGYSDLMSAVCPSICIGARSHVGVWDGDQYYPDSHYFEEVLRQWGTQFQIHYDWYSELKAVFEHSVFLQ